MQWHGDQATRKLRREVHNAVEMSGHVFFREAQRRIRKRSGKSLAEVEKYSEDGEFHVLTDYFVGRLLETGTVKMKAYPWLRPAYQVARKDLIHRLKRLGLDYHGTSSGFGVFTR